MIKISTVIKSVDDCFIMGDSPCWYCGRPQEPAVTFVAEHMQPLSCGGLDVPGNLVVACAKCNSNKADCNIEEYRALLRQRTGSDVVFYGEGE